MQQYDIDKWISRIQNDIDVQKDLQLELIKETYNRRDLMELLIMLKDLKSVIENNTG